ncbi:MAG: hypothetical protein CME62_17685 [Halobacteriovoraceae bacterium]|nr:hypothetical protein [Halobacteriovoraceae bacterium]|tara:strand:+ start:5427 stop:5615 length:189 start_codon:yes stop_codon:yes gene_type:complete
MKLANALNDKKMDVRVVDRLIAEGKVTKSDVDKYLNELPDDSNNFERIEHEERRSSAGSTEQ